MPVCIICEQVIPDDNYRIIEVVKEKDTNQVVICVWCAQLIKETFED